MPSPFPGMDPYLEDPATWQDLHHRLISSISRQLQPQLVPLYFARIGERLYLEDVRHAMYPDLGIFRGARGVKTRGGAATLAADEPVVLTWETQCREPYLEIRSATSHEVVTVIEVLSPGNKAPGSHGRAEYQRKQEDVVATPVHLVEIDLLRSGAATVFGTPGAMLLLPHYDYLVCVSRAPRRDSGEVYHFTLRDRLPRVKVPLRDPDPDALLDLPAVFHECYEEGAYPYAVDYRRPPPEPALRPQDAEWLDRLLRETGLRPADPIAPD